MYCMNMYAADGGLTTIIRTDGQKKGWFVPGRPEAGTDLIVTVSAFLTGFLGASDC